MCPVSRRFLQSADLGALSHSAPDLAQVFVSLSSDIALVIDRDGLVLDVAQDPRRPWMQQAQDWIGKPWVDTVTPETRTKIAQLLHDADQPDRARRREVNHLSGTAHGPGTSSSPAGSSDTTDMPVSYAALRLGTDGPVLAVGRDLRLASGVQQRFLQAQQALERSYWQERQSAARDWMLLHVATDAVLTVDLHQLQVQRCNAPALRLWHGTAAPAGQTLAGQALSRLFDSRSDALVRQAIHRAGEGHRPMAMQARLAGSHITVDLQVLALPTQPHAVPTVLLRARCTAPLGALGSSLDATLHHWLAGAHEGVVVTDERGLILAANRTFACLSAQADEALLLNQPLQSYLTPSTADESTADDLSAWQAAAMAQGLVHARDLRLVERPAGGASVMDGSQRQRGGQNTDGSRGDAPQAVQATVTRLFEAGQAVVGWVLRSHAGGEPGPWGIGSESEVGLRSDAFPRER